MEKIIYRKTLDVHKNGIQFTLQGFETADKLARRIEINLTASGDTYELPLGGVVALMYITTPDAEEPSIEECSIKDNTIVYDVLPIVEEGITEMQLKLIGTNYDGAKAVLVAPRFAIEVEQSNTEDEDAEQTTTYTALENAVAKASAVYYSRLLRVEFDELCVFRAFYADGTVYESDELRRLLLQQNTDVNLASMVTDGIANIAADDVATVLDERYKELFASAEYIENVATAFEKPCFFRWDITTQNTAYKAGLTSDTNGFGLVYGDPLTRHTAVTWTASGEAFVRKTIEGATEWTSCLTNKGGTVNGDLHLVKENPAITFEDKGGALNGKVGRDTQGAMLVEAADVNGATNGIKVTTSADVNEGLAYSHTADGETKDYKLYGEHNLPHPAQIYSGTYEGTGESSEAYDKTITAPFRPQIVYLAGHIAVRPSTSAYLSVPSMITKCDVTWGEEDNTITFKRRSGGVADSGTKFNVKGKVYPYIIIGY